MIFKIFNIRYWLYSLLLLFYWQFQQVNAQSCALSCDFKAGGAVTWTTTGNNINVTTTNRYVLVDIATQLIAYSSSSLPIYNVAAGNYAAYTVNYDNGSAAPNLSVGTNLNAIGGTCVSLSNALNLSVCEVAGCNYGLGEGVTWISSDYNTDANFTTRYVLVDALTGLISHSSATLPISDVALGTYIAYTLNYDNTLIAPNISVGNVITEIGGMCVSKSNGLFIVICAPTCDNSVEAPISSNTNAAISTQYVLTDGRNYIVQTSNSTLFSALPNGIYNAYKIDYNSSNTPNFSIGTSLSNIGGSVVDMSCPVGANISGILLQCSHEDAIIINDGTASVAVAGGTGLYSYIWNNNATTATINNLSAGTYSVTVTDGAGCTASCEQVVAGNEIVATVTPMSDTTFCAGSSVILVADGGNTFAWSTGATTQAIVASTSATYSVTVSNSATGYSATASQVVTVNPLPIASIDPAGNTILCAGEATTFTANGGGSYLWSTGATTQSILVNAAGSYTVTVTDNASACSASATATITQSAIALAVASTTTDVLCFGATTGAIDITASGGAGAYTYDWADLAGTSNSQDRTTLAAGTYTVTVTDANGCTASTTATVAQPATALAVSLTLGDNAACANETAIALTGGSPAGGTYSGVGVIGSTFYPAIAGTGSAIITYNYTDSNGCSGSATATMTVHSLPLVAFTLIDEATCVSESAIALAGGTPIGGTYSGVGIVNNNFEPAIAGVGSHTITYTYTDPNGCSASATDLITVSAQPNAATLADATYCVGATAAVLEATVAGANYLWSNGATTASITPLTSNIGTTTYMVTVTIGACAVTRSATIAVNNCSTGTIGNIVWSDLDGDGQQDIGEAGLGGVSVTLTYPDGTTTTITTNPDGSYTFTGLAAGNYTVAVGTGPNGTTLSTTNTYGVLLSTGQNYIDANFGFEPTGTIGNYVWSDLSGDGQQNDGVASGLNGVAVLLYADTNADGLPDGAAISSTTTSNDISGNPGYYEFSNVPAGSYVIQFIAPSSYGYADIQNGGAISSSSNTTDNDSNIANTATGYTGTITLGIAETINTVDAGLVLLSVCEANAGDIAQVELCEGAYPLTTPAGWTPLPIFGGTYGAAPSPAADYSFQYFITNDLPAPHTILVALAANVLPTATDINALTAGTYRLYRVSWKSSGTGSGTLQDASGGTVGVGDNVEALGTSAIVDCIDLAYAYIMVRPTPVLAMSSNAPVCAGEVLSLVATQTNASANPVSYTWSGPNAYNSSLQAPTIFNAQLSNGGTYNVTATTGFGCTTVANLAATVNTPPIANAGLDQVTCAGTGIAIGSAAVADNNYAWSPSAGLSSAAIANPTANPSATTLYTVTVTSAAGCTASDNVLVTVNAVPVPVVSNNGPLCDTRDIILTALGGSTYAWSGPNGFASSNPNPTILATSSQFPGPGNWVYTVTVSNGNCSATASTTVVVNDSPDITVSANSPLCAGNTLMLTSNYTNTTNNDIYQWSGPLGFTSTLPNPSIANATIQRAGIYTLLVANEYGCTAVATVIVSVNTLPNPTISSNVTCSGGLANLSLWVPNAGLGATYAWSGTGAGMGNNQTISGLSAGSQTYTVTVTNAVGCTSSSSKTIVIPSCVVCNAQAGTVQVSNACINEPIAATVTGNTTSSGYTTQFIVANSTGTIVYVGNSPIPAQPAGAYTVYSYNYSSAPTPAPAVGLSVATYALGLVNGGCYDVSDSGAAMTIYNGSPALVSMQNIEEGNTGGISPFYYTIDQVLIEGGSIPYNFNWDNNGYVRYDIEYGDHDGDGIEDAFITIYYADNATWACTITDDVTCSGTGELVFTNVPGIDTNPILDIDNYVITPESSTSSNGAITLYVSGGTPCASPDSYTYQWAGPTTWTGAAAASGGGGATETITGLPWGWYSVTVTDCSGQTTEGWYWVPRARRGRSKVEESGVGLVAMPNPFSDLTTIEFQTTQDGIATVEVYAVDGKRVATLYNDLVVADELYSVQLSADNLPAGVYTIELSTDKGERSTYKVLLTK
jgi:hypothetical protein